MLKNSGRLKAGPFLVAVSGGADSVALLFLLRSFFSHLPGCTLHVLHFNHKLRGEESERDECFVQSLASNLGLDCISGAAPVGEYARSSGESLEMVARRWRYQFFSDVAKRLGAGIIFMGHHANDQVELFFLRFFRGASSEGLKGMRVISPFPFSTTVDLEVIRPLLYCGRKEIEDYLRVCGVSWVNDSTNASNEMLRNKIRHQIIPLLETEYPQGAIPAISKTMSVLSDEADYLTQAVQTVRGGGIPFEQWHIALRRRAMAEELIQFGVSPSLEIIEHLIFYATKAIACRTTDDKHVLIYREQGSSKLVSRESIQREFIQSEQECSVEIGAAEHGVVELPGTSASGIIRVEWRKFLHTGGVSFLKDKSSRREYFDFDRVGRRILFRHWRAGDRFQPIGLVFSKKLQDVFVNEKIAMEERQGLWLLENEEGLIFWVQGVRIGDVCKVTEKTRMVVQVDFFDKNTD